MNFMNFHENQNKLAIESGDQATLYVSVSDGQDIPVLGVGNTPFVYGGPGPPPK